MEGDEDDRTNERDERRSTNLNLGEIRKHGVYFHFAPSHYMYRNYRFIFEERKFSRPGTMT